MKNSVGKSFTMVLQIGISMVVPIALCVAGALWLEQKFEIEWPFIPALLLGIGAGIRNVWLMVKSYTKNDNSREAKANEAVQKMLAEGRKRKKDKSVK